MDELHETEHVEEARHACRRRAGRTHRAAHQPPHGQRQVSVPVGSNEVDPESEGSALKGVATEDERGTTGRATPTGDQTQQRRLASTVGSNLRGTRSRCTALHEEKIGGRAAWRRARTRTTREPGDTARETSEKTGADDGEYAKRTADSARADMATERSREKR